MIHGLLHCVCCSCCCGPPTRCLKSWQTSSDSSTKPCTRSEPTSTATATLSVYWTWRRKRWWCVCVFQCNIRLLVSMKCWLLLHVPSPPGVLRYLAGVDGRAATVLRPCDPWWKGTTHCTFNITVIVVTATNLLLMCFILLQEVIFYKVIDYILHGKEDIKVIPWVNP